MQTKYTPGPWRVGDAGHTVFGPKTEAPSPKTICTLGPFNTKANARLIAAAPELLLALETIINLKAVSYNFDYEELYGAITALAQATIHKATGE